MNCVACGIVKKIVVKNPQEGVTNVENQENINIKRLHVSHENIPEKRKLKMSQ